MQAHVRGKALAQSLLKACGKHLTLDHRLLDIEWRCLIASRRPGYERVRAHAAEDVTLSLIALAAQPNGCDPSRCDCGEFDTGDAARADSGGVMPTLLSTGASYCMVGSRRPSEGIGSSR